MALSQETCSYNCYKKGCSLRVCAGNCALYQLAKQAGYHNAVVKVLEMTDNLTRLFFAKYLGLTKKLEEN